MSSHNHAIILLAAGNSSRMGSLKQLLDYNGKPLVQHAAEVALASGCAKVVVVVGANAAQVAGALTDMPVEIVQNTLWAEGMGTSIQAGVRAVEALGLPGAILALADQPLITPAILRNLADEHHRTGKPIVASQYAGTVGVPVYFAQSHFAPLLALAPDQGCKGVILKHGNESLRIDYPEAEVDIDTPADYERLALAR